MAKRNKTAINEIVNEIKAENATETENNGGMGHNRPMIVLPDWAIQKEIDLDKTSMFVGKVIDKTRVACNDASSSISKLEMNFFTSLSVAAGSLVAAGLEAGLQWEREDSKGETETVEFSLNFDDADKANESLAMIRKVLRQGAVASFGKNSVPSTAGQYINTAAPLAAVLLAKGYLSLGFAKPKSGLGAMAKAEKTGDYSVQVLTCSSNVLQPEVVSKDRNGKRGDASENTSTSPVVVNKEGVSLLYDKLILKDEKIGTDADGFLVRKRDKKAEKTGDKAATPTDNIKAGEELAALKAALDPAKVIETLADTVRDAPETVRTAGANILAILYAAEDLVVSNADKLKGASPETGLGEALRALHKAIGELLV